MGAFWIGKSRSLALVGGSRGVRNLHSLPSHYGLMTAMWCALPALAVIALWLMFQDAIILRLVTDHLPAGVRDLPENDLSLVLNDMRNLVAGNVPADVGQRVGASRRSRVPAAARHQPHGAHGARHGAGDRRGASWCARASLRSCARAMASSA